MPIQTILRPECQQALRQPVQFSGQRGLVLPAVLAGAIGFLAGTGDGFHRTSQRQLAESQSALAELSRQVEHAEHAVLTRTQAPAIYNLPTAAAKVIDTSVLITKKSQRSASPFAELQEATNYNSGLWVQDQQGRLLILASAKGWPPYEDPLSHGKDAWESPPGEENSFEVTYWDTALQAPATIKTQIARSATGNLLFSPEKNLMVLEPENPAEVKNVAIITAYRDLQKSPLEAGDNVLTAASSLSYPRQSTAGIIGNWDPENIIADAPINRGGGGGGLFDLNGHLIGIAQSPPHLIKGQVQPNQLQLKSMYQGSDVVQYNTYPTTRFRDGGGRFVPIATIQRNLAEMGLTLQLMPAAATDGGRP